MFIDQHKAEYGVEPIITAWEDTPAQIALSSYYAAKNRPPSERELRDRDLCEKIARIHENNYGVYGVRKIHAALRRAGERAAESTVRRLMRKLGLRGISRAKGPRTTKPAPETGRPLDLVNRQFIATRPNELWVADITYVRTFSGWVYVAFVLDVYSRMIVGWQVSTRLYTDLALDALRMGIWRRQRQGQYLTGLIHHSDRGVQGGFNWSSQHPEYGGVHEWRGRTGSRRRAMCPRECGGNGARIGRYGRRCARQGGPSPLGRCSGSSGG
ncbi:IS3 family transposase [Leucobacter sp. GX0328]